MAERMKRLTTSSVVAITAGLFAAPVLAATDRVNENPYTQPDDTWVSLSGKAIDTSADTFKLDYGDGVITVEMDDWDWYEESREVVENDKVTVYGEIDDTFFDTARIEAASVYVESLGTYFYGPTAADEEGTGDEDDYWLTGEPIESGEIDVRGTVSSVGEEKFTIDQGASKLTVDTDDLAYNPLDSQGYVRINEGDYVSVSGEMDDDFLESRLLEADYAVVIEDDGSEG